MRNTILQGDALKRLKELPKNFVDCVVTSPPYWGLRDYGTNGQLGLESTLEEYIQKLTEIFREVRRVLKDEGTLWLNMGDGYAGSGKGYGSDHGKAVYTDEHIARTDWSKTSLKPKDLIGQPWRLAFALQADGWYLRSDIIWAKPNPMPESVTDRPTKSHEYIFLMSKQPRYFYDIDAVRESCESGPSDIQKMIEGKERIGGKNKVLDDRFNKASKYTNIGQKRSVGDPSGRNKRTVWTVATQPFPEAHFATFPEKLIEPCIRAGTSEKGYCGECGKPWVRVVETKAGESKNCPKTQAAHEARGGTGQPTGTVGKSGSGRTDGYSKTTGWRPSCSCGADTVPGLVLDPFMGSGTTALVALKLNRDYLGIELNPEYIEIANKRLQEMALFATCERQ